MTAAPARGAGDGAASLPPGTDSDAAARGALYGLLRAAFEPPDEAFHAALADGSLEGTVGELLALTGLEVTRPELTTDEGYEALTTDYHDLFVLGYAEHEDPGDGTLVASGPPVPLHESAHRTDAAWGDVNLDLARAYDYFGLAIDETDRDHHDGLGLELSFAGYLARREAAVDADAAAARLDLLDRHLRVLVRGLVEGLGEVGETGPYAALVDLLDGFTAADRDDLADRLAGAR